MRMENINEQEQLEQEYLTQTPNIQWFPGHMAKTRRVMKESLKLVDIVVELRDARIPKSSRNPEIEKIVGDKPRLVVFNKADIADPAVTKEWQEYYKSHGVRTLALDCRSGKGLKELVPAVLTLDGRRVALTALVDTGNTLTDPATGRPVMVAEGEKLSPLLPEPLGPEALRDPVGSLERLSRAGEGQRFRLLPYQAVGVECGMLLALRLDGARVGTEDYGKLLLALSPTRLTDGGGYHALIGT